MSICLLIYCLLLFLVAPIVCGGSVLVLGLLFCTLCPSSFAIILMGKRENYCFTLTVFLIYCDSHCSLALPLSLSTVGWSAVCDYGISWSDSLAVL